MKKEKTEFSVVNVFAESSETERKIRVNNAISKLCSMDIENNFIDNMSATACDSITPLDKGGAP